MRFGSVLMFAAAAPLLTGASQPVRLQPSSGWIVDYAENSCRLIRTFGEASRPVKLAFESESPQRMDMLAIGKPLANDAEKVGARFLPGQSEVMKGRTAQSTTSGDAAILWPHVGLLPDDLLKELRKDWDEDKSKPASRPPPIDFEKRARNEARRLQFADQATELEIQTRRGRPVILETGSLGNAIRALDKCNRDSLTDWGVSPDVEDRIARPVWPLEPASKWFNDADYPPEMITTGDESEVTVRVLVDSSGRVTKCTSISHFKEAAFNEITCRNFTTRARFAPAELADGTKVPSYYTKRIVFRMAR